MGSVTDERTGTLRGLVFDGAVTPVFQPVVHLDTGCVVGYEALVRGPADRGLRCPQALFAAARREGRLRELDWACRWAAVGAARRAGLHYPLALFVNAEPEALAGPPGEGPGQWSQMGDLRCFAEITERALTRRPGELLRLADIVRSMDWGIALDDIGANPETVALMPMLQPDVLKLDLRALREHDRLEVAQVTHAVMAQAAETGATVVAEGIENEQQRDFAVALGADLGQGWFFGYPGALPEALPSTARPVGLLPRVWDRAVSPSPYAAVNDAQRARRATRAAVEGVWHQLEQQARALRPAPVVLAALPDEASFAAAAPELSALGRDLPLVAALLGPGVQGRAPGLRTQSLSPGDPAGADWGLVVVGPHYGAAVVGRLLPDGAAGSASAVEFVVTFSRPLVVRAANAILTRLDAVSAGPGPRLA